MPPCQHQHEPQPEDPNHLNSAQKTTAPIFPVEKLSPARTGIHVHARELGILPFQGDKLKSSWANRSPSFPHQGPGWLQDRGLRFVTERRKEVLSLVYIPSLQEVKPEGRWGSWAPGLVSSAQRQLEKADSTARAEEGETWFSLTRVQRKGEDP